MSFITKSDMNEYKINKIVYKLIVTYTPIIYKIYKPLGYMLLEFCILLFYPIDAKL